MASILLRGSPVLPEEALLWTGLVFDRPASLAAAPSRGDRLAAFFRNLCLWQCCRPPSQGCHRVYVFPGPMHPRAFQPGLHHQLVGALHRPAADGIPLGLELGIPDLLPASRYSRLPLTVLSAPASVSFTSANSRHNALRLPSASSGSPCFSGFPATAGGGGSRSEGGLIGQLRPVAPVQNRSGRSGR